MCKQSLKLVYVNAFISCQYHNPTVSIACLSYSLEYYIIKRDKNNDQRQNYCACSHLYKHEIVYP
ncbi:hypothetical protein X975_22953, partial [Stegodyphus mimosarum]